MHHLIFDFDGVLADTRQACAKATAHIQNIDVVEAARQNMEYASNKPNHTRDHTRTAEEMARAYQWTQDFGLQMKVIGFPMFTDFVKEVELLPTSHKAVVSSGSQQYILPAVAKTNLNPTHTLAYENHHSKEEKIELICADWGIEPSEAFYFTDTLADVYELQDMITPEKLIGVSWGYCGKEVLLKGLKAENILNVASDIHTVLAR